MHCGDCIYLRKNRFFTQIETPPHISIGCIVIVIAFVIINSAICSHHLSQVGERLGADDLTIAPFFNGEAVLADLKWNQAEEVEGATSLPLWSTKHLAVI